MEDPSTTSTTSTKLLGKYKIYVAPISDEATNEKVTQLVVDEGAQIVNRIEGGQSDFVILIPNGPIRETKKLAYVKKRSTATAVITNSLCLFF